MRQYFEHFCLPSCQFTVHSKVAEVGHGLSTRHYPDRERLIQQSVHLFTLLPDIAIQLTAEVACTPNAQVITHHNQSSKKQNLGKEAPGKPNNTERE
jgi:hypothetical protein